MREVADAFGTAIVGGDTNTWDGPLVVSVTVMGEVVGRGGVLRRGASAGDWVMVTGPLGGSLLGKHLDFTPRVARRWNSMHRAAEGDDRCERWAGGGFEANLRGEQVRGCPAGGGDSDQRGWARRMKDGVSAWSMLSGMGRISSWSLRWRRRTGGGSWRRSRWGGSRSAISGSFVKRGCGWRRWGEERVAWLGV